MQNKKQKKIQTKTNTTNKKTQPIILKKKKVIKNLKKPKNKNTKNKNTKNKNTKNKNTKNKNTKNKNTKNENTKKINQIKKKVLPKITPTTKDLLQEKKLFEKIKTKILKQNHNIQVEWCGSSARNTHLKNDKDLDLFILFDTKLSEQELEKKGLKIGKSVFKGHKWEKAYSQHPYIRGEINNFEIEIVPGYIVQKGSEKKSAVDRTPFHNKYLLEKLTENQKKEVRILKQFFKGINAYGADLKSCSLPGYGIELLILKYADFENALKKISKWKKNQTIKFNNEKNIPSFENPLIIIDPIDPKRNVASALTTEQFEKIIYASKKFLEKPSMNFFYPKKQKLLQTKHAKKMLEQKEIIAIKTIFPQKEIKDIIWGQLRKTLKKINTFLQEHDYIITKKTLWSNEKEVWFIYELNEIELQKTKKLIGPNINDKENVKRFLEKKRKILSEPIIENKKIVIEVERENTNAKTILNEYLKINSKSEKKEMQTMLKSGTIFSKQEIIKEYKKDFAEFLTLYLKEKQVFQ